MKQQSPHIGIYLYGWHEGAKWSNHKVRHTPLPGYYDSGDIELNQWQVEQIARLDVDFAILELIPVHDHSFLLPDPMVIPRVEVGSILQRRHMYQDTLKQRIQEKEIENSALKNNKAKTGKQQNLWGPVSQHSIYNKY